MFCRKCGHKLNDDAKFCPKCGTAVRDNDQKQQSLDNEPVSTNDSQETVNENIKNNSNKKKKSERKKKKRLPVILFILIAIVAGYLFATYNFSLGIRIPKKENPDYEMVITGEGSNSTVYELDAKNIVEDTRTGIKYVNNIIIVSFKNGTSDDDINRFAASIGGVIVGGFPDLYRYQIEISERTLEELDSLCEEVGKSDIVKDAHIDMPYESEPDSYPSDPWNTKWYSWLLGEKWDEENPDGNNWWQEAINTPSAWEYDSFFESVHIGVVDSGFDLEHEDLTGVIKSYSPENNVQKHGTHVTGIIGAKDNNSIGVTGVVWNAEIYTSDVGRSETEKNDEGVYETKENIQSTEIILKEIEKLIKYHDCKVINMSLGKSGKLSEDRFTDEFIDYEGQVASSMMRDLLDVKDEKGVRKYDFIIVQSAGNGNERPKRTEEKDGDKKEKDQDKEETENVPVNSLYNGSFCSIRESNCEFSEDTSKEDIMNRIIIVGAAQNNHDGSYSCASFSNYGDHVDIWAPGTEIYSTVPGGYDKLQGTSMAAPIVTGVTALVWKADNSLTGDQVKAIVCDNDNKKYLVTGDQSRDFYGFDHYGMINAQLAVEAAIDGKLTKDSDLVEKPIASEKEKKAKEKTFGGIVVSPEDVVLKLYKSLKDGNYDKAAECLDPTTEQGIGLVGGLVENAVGFVTGDKMSWSQLLSDITGGTDVEVIECNAYNMKAEYDNEVISSLLDKMRGLQKFAYTEADVYVKYRYKFDDEYYVDEYVYHVKRYGISDWRIEVDLLGG